jgi:hypothetical protein
MSEPPEEAGAADDPRRIRSVAVTVEDVVSALEANVRRDVEAVLRVTPPFHPRERARLHLAGGEGDYGERRPLHLDPADLLSDRPPYPTPDATEDELREAGEYTPERHRRRHVEAVETWRRAVASSLVSELAIPAGDGEHVVEVKALGGP